MFECKLCVDTIMRIQTEIPRIIVLTVVPPTGKQCNVSVLVERVGDSFGAMLQLTVDHRMLIPPKMLTRSVLIVVVVLRLVTTATIVTRGQDSRTRRGAGGSRAMVRYLLVLCSAPSVPQPVVQSRRRPLLGPSPG